MYHEVTKESNFLMMSRKTQRSYVMDCVKFEEQMDYLSENRFKTLSVDGLCCLLKQNQKEIGDRQKYIVLSFDDGFIGNYEYVFPILQEKGFIGNFFLITSEIGQRYMMGWEQIREMRKYGMFFGSHTVGHRLLGTLNSKEIFYELDYSKKNIEDNLSQKIQYFSLPHGSYKKGYSCIALEIGYTGGCTSNPGINDFATDPFLLKRMTVPRNASFHYFTSICEKRGYVYSKVIVKKNIIKAVKRLVGESVYLSMYNRFFDVENQ